MRLLLMRHAEAEPGCDADPLRALTASARIRLAAPEAAILAELQSLHSVLCSPYRRALDTAGLLLRSAGQGTLSPLVDDALCPTATLDAAVTLLQQYIDDGPLLVVTHQPLIGRLIPWLCDGATAPALAPSPGEMALIELEWPAAGLGRLLRWHRL